MKHMVPPGPYTMYEDTSFGRQYENVCATVAVGHLATGVGLLFVRRAVSTALCGDAIHTSLDATVCDWVGEGSVMMITALANAAVSSTSLSATCEW